MKTLPFPEMIRYTKIRSRYMLTGGLLLSVMLSGCQEISESIERTRHPRPEHPAAENKNHTASSVSTSSGTTTSSSTTTTGEPAKQPVKRLFDRSAAGLDSIQQQLRDLPALKGKKLFFHQSFYFYDFDGGIISIHLQDPDKKENVDAYTYRNGEWEQTAPVKITGNIPMEEGLMPLDEVKFGTAKKVYDIAVERAKTIEGAGRITHIYFNQMKRVNVKEWYLSVKGDRHDYFLEFDINGNLKKVR